MKNNITTLTKIDIKEYRNANPKNHILVKRISETEAFLLSVSPSKFTEDDLLCEGITQGFNPDSLEIIPALTPNLASYNGFDTDEILAD